ncbi:Zinc finger BED domain-containing protein RICESLEEPER 2 [Fusarium oxysporum f. sp. albedinis]|nr:Zinc finger BED domain-containing protein RICESLEEPER 2 [Fusarium oxysporum f. sp. albedinis]
MCALRYILQRTIYSLYLVYELTKARTSINVVYVTDSTIHLGPWLAEMGTVWDDSTAASEQRAGDADGVSRSHRSLDSLPVNWPHLSLLDSIHSSFHDTSSIHHI